VLLDYVFLTRVRIQDQHKSISLTDPIDFKLQSNSDLKHV